MLVLLRIYICKLFSIVYIIKRSYDSAAVAVNRNHESAFIERTDFNIRELYEAWVQTACNYHKDA